MRRINRGWIHQIRFDGKSFWKCFCARRSFCFDYHQFRNSKRCVSHWMIVCWVASRCIYNKAGYTATEVACGWAGAIFEVTRLLEQEQWGPRNKIRKKSSVTDRPTDRWTMRVVESRARDKKNSALLHGEAIGFMPELNPLSLDLITTGKSVSNDVGLLNECQKNRKQVLTRSAQSKR